MRLSRRVDPGSWIPHLEHKDNAQSDIRWMAFQVVAPRRISILVTLLVRDAGRGKSPALVHLRVLLRVTDTYAVAVDLEGPIRQGLAGIASGVVSRYSTR